jgi:1-acyl-sn-glycerol-3-phosphate acyltransferase
MFRIIAMVFWTFWAAFQTVIEAFFRHPKREVIDARLDAWCDRVVKLSHMKIEVQGKENLPKKGEAALYMSNHQSLMDIPVLYRALPHSLRMVGKKELFAIPVFGRGMRYSEYICIDRENRESAIQSLSEAKNKLLSGIRLYMAPEGTRSKEGKLLPFKKGGFVIAEQLQIPIVPISIAGADRVLPARSLSLSLGETVVVTIHPPISPIAPKEDWMERVRTAIASKMEKKLD